MKSVLISIRPKWAEKIARGEKTIDVRKTVPKEVPFKSYIYCTKGKDGYEWLYRVDNNGYGKAISWHGKVIGEFICDEVYEWKYDYCDGVDIDDDLILDTCICREDINIYAKGKTLYGWHISDLKIYDKPKSIMTFYKPCPIKLGFKNCPCCEFYSTYTGFCMNQIDRPPQSWCYVEEV